VIADGQYPFIYALYIRVYAQLLQVYIGFDAIRLFNIYAAIIKIPFFCMIDEIEVGNSLLPHPLKHEPGRIVVEKDKDGGDKDGDNNAQRNQK
jgi:hypothetical protein